MATQVLYRKWRPQRFADVVGQQPVTLTLQQAVISGRLAHAYLFSGPRGTGKTSTARVLAKVVGCLDRPEGVSDPCGKCAGCLAIEQGNFVDLIEIDAASNRGIDEMRDLREKVHFAPGQSKYKVYIIDEAHMLTDAAFNAFLKTLEEPPPHTIFILATTEPHRLPATIISRCQRFDFRRISISQIIDRLSQISAAEGIAASPEALREIARAGGGSLRDATNLLDQLVTAYGARIDQDSVRDLLGIAGEERALVLVKHLLAGSTAQALTLINTMAADGLDLRPLHRSTVDFLRSVLLLKSGVKDPQDLSKEAQQELGFFASNISLERVLRALRLFGQVSLKHDQPSPLPLELATVELDFEPEPATIRLATPTEPPPAVAVGAPPQLPNAPAPPEPTPAPADPQAGPPPHDPSPAAVSNNNGGSAPPLPPSEGGLDQQWLSIVRDMNRVKGARFNIGALLRSSNAHYLDGNALVVRFTHQSNSERLQAELDEPQCRQTLEEVLQRILGSSYTVRVETDTKNVRGRAVADQSHMVRAAISMGAKVVPGENQEHEAVEELSNE